MLRYLTPVAFLLSFAASASLTAAAEPLESSADPFLGEAQFDVQQVFRGDRFPNVVVATDGTVLAFFNGVKVRRSADGGKTWGEEIQCEPPARSAN